MSYNEFRRWLKSQGATFKTKKSGTSHQIVTLNGKSSIFPDHRNKEMGNGLIRAIKEDLGLK